MTTTDSPVRSADATHRRAASRALYALLSAHAISQTGNVITAFAIPFYVLATGGSGVEVGLAAFAATAPVIVGGVFGGVVIDRIGGRRTAIVADIVSGVTVLAIPALALTVGLPFWALLALVFTSGVLDTPGQIARRVMLPELTETARVRIERSVGLLDGSERLSKLIGASVAGALVALLGPMAALVTNAVAFLISAAITRLMVPATTVRMAADGDTDAAARRSYWRELRDGFRFVVRDPLMRLIVGMVLITNLLDAARSASLMPLYANAELGGAGALAVIVAVMGGSALIGNVAFGFIAHRMPRRVTFALCFLVAGGPSSAVFALGAPFPVLVAAAGISGLAAGALNPILGAVQLERVPAPMRGRVFGLINAGTWAGVPLGALLGGIAADGLGLFASFGIVAIIYTVVTTAPLAGGAWRLMERRPNEQTAL
ncbi:MFS transporter [Microbacterium sp. AISO3]|uniref:MFS transporter n=1 Tax=unclassified Microbacterium TaxID=2609290 RepID=UPI00038F3D52|nr:MULTISPECIES: MFS transporter [unclassified Microbacterium]OWP22392.1 MFS transporter [Microbacterium sp. AISO3]GAD35257.1 putative permease [Microbacterium sp. TS-1]